jgi:hypothetical protein
VSLSDRGVKKLLNDQFICTWVNIADDPAAGSSHPHPCTDAANELARGLGEHNLQLLILTPDGRLLSAMAGYIGPAALLEELQFGRSQWETLQKTPEAERRRSLEKAHKEFARTLAERKGGDGLVGQQEEFFGKLKMVGNQRGVADHEFSARKALLPVEKFTTALMVGNAKSAFMAQASGSENPPRALPALPRTIFTPIK